MKKTRAKKSQAKNERVTQPRGESAPRADDPQGADHEEPATPQAQEPTTGGEQEVVTTPGPPTPEQLEAKVASLEDSLLRAKADYQNLKRRGIIERSEAIRFANAELMRSLLPVLDDFERSLTAGEDSGKGTAVVDGVRLVYENVLKALREHGLSAIDALHRPFDPSVHEALMQKPSTDHPSQTVIEEIAKGYRLGDRVLRPAKVVVTKRVEQTPQEQESAGQTQQEAQT